MNIKKSKTSVKKKNKQFQVYTIANTMRGLIVRRKLQIKREGESHKARALLSLKKGNFLNQIRELL